MRWRLLARRTDSPENPATTTPTSAREHALESSQPNELASDLAPYISDAALLHLALSHRSYCAEAPGEQSNERLEFLGDSVLGIVVTEYIYRNYPDMPEGDLARIRSAVVSTEALAPIARELGVGPAIHLGRGEAASGGREKASILADALEALIGASYLSGGLEAARAFVEHVLLVAINEAAQVESLGDAKNRLQEQAARRGLGSPNYRLTSHGPDHAKHFTAEVELQGRIAGQGEGRSKKQAERAAAEMALSSLAASDQTVSPEKDQ